jgi:hypothetical protein
MNDPAEDTPLSPFLTLTVLIDRVESYQFMLNCG